MDLDRKSIFVFCCYLPAKRYGGPTKSIYNLVETTGDFYEYYLISLNHDAQQTEMLDEIKPGWNIVGKANVLYVSEKDFSYRNILNWMKACNAAMVYLSSVYYYQFNFPAVKAANTLKIPVLLAPRSDLLKNCIKHKFTKKFIYLTILRFIQKYKGIWYQSTSDEETESILKWMKTDSDHIVQLPNIASHPLDRERTRKERGNIRIVYIGRIHPRKNLKYAVECLTRLSDHASLDIYGAMEDEAYWRECEKTAINMGKEKSLKYCGVLSPLEIQIKYYEYDLLFFPTLNENYGHVIVEAIVAGCPALISKGTTPWDDYDGNGGFCCDLDKPDEFVKVLEKIQKMDNDEFQELVEKNRAYAKRRFDNSNLCHQYIDMFKKIITS